MTDNLNIIDKEGVKKDIEKMDKHHHIEILKIISKTSLSHINENKSGVYINMSLLSNDTINEIYKYVNHVKYQEELLNPIEKQKNTLKNTFYSNIVDKDIPIEYMTKANKDNNISIFSYE